MNAQHQAAKNKKKQESEQVDSDKEDEATAKAPQMLSYVENTNIKGMQISTNFEWALEILKKNKNEGFVIFSELYDNTTHTLTH